MSTAVMGVDSSHNTAAWNHNQEPCSPTEGRSPWELPTNSPISCEMWGRCRGRIYLPLQDLARFNYTEQDLFKGVVDQRWRELMRFQIQRTRQVYARRKGESVAYLPDARWPVWAALMLYSQILM